MKALRFSVTVPKFIAAKGLASIFGRRVYYQGPLKTIRIADISEPMISPPAFVGAGFAEITKTDNSGF